MIKAAEKIKRFCHEEKLTMEDFAKAIRSDVTSLYRYMRGARTPKKEVVEAIYIFTEGYIEPNDFYEIKERKQ